MNGGTWPTEADLRRFHAAEIRAVFPTREDDRLGCMYDFEAWASMVAASTPTLREVGRWLDAHPVPPGADPVIDALSAIEDAEDALATECGVTLPAGYDQRWREVVEPVIRAALAAAAGGAS